MYPQIKIGMHFSVLLFLGNLFSSDMLIILMVALMLFGGEKLPEIARGIGKGLRDFKDASEGVKREINNQINSFEEKRTETNLNNQALQTQLSAGTVTDTHPVVENTVPIQDTYHNAVTETVVEEKPEEKPLEAVSVHKIEIPQPAHIEESEPIKNS